MDLLPTTTAASTTGEAKLSDLFVLTDEQILEIEPQSQQEMATDPSALRTRDNSASTREAPIATVERTEDIAVRGGHDAAEPPAWLAAQMQDAWGGEEAREFWDGVQQARSEAAAYRAAIATPEDARALKELYPGGVNEARAAAERGRLLDEVDRAYFGAAGSSPEQLSAPRAQLAQRMLRDDPADFREMVEAGVRALQEVTEVQGRTGKSVASAVSDARNDTSTGSAGASFVVAQHAAPLPGNQPNAATSGAAHNEAQVAAYAAFERAANEDLERSVGSAIERTLRQALPANDRSYTPGQAGAQRAAPLHEKLASSIRVDVEKAVQGDRQLGEQVAQILSSRRFDNDARTQIVRLIGERAQQLVPSAAKRVLNEWTQTTLAAHRGRTQRADSASATADTAVASAPGRSGANNQANARQQDASRRTGQASATKSQSVNYRKLSDEQILEL